VQVAEAAKRMHYKSGGHDEELQQYVRWEDMKPKGPKVIKLDNPEGKKEYKPPQTINIHLSKIPMPELQPKAPPKPSLSPLQESSSSGPMSWFGFGAGPSDAKLRPSLAQSSSSSNLRPLSGSSHGTSSPGSSQAGSSRPSTTPSPAAPPKDKHRKDKDKDKDKEKKDRLRKGQQPPSNGRPNIPPHPNPYGARPPKLPQTPAQQRPRQSFYDGFTGAYTQQPQQPPKPSPTPPGGFAPPPGPPPAQSTGITGTLANVGYSLLGRLTNNTTSTGPK